MAKDATIPVSDKQEATPAGDKGTITSGKPKEAPAPSPDAEKKVAELEATVESLTKQVKQANDLQRQADKGKRIEKRERQKLEKTLQKIREGETYIPPEVPEGETATEREIRLEARIGIQNMIIENPEYQKLLSQDITLREVIKNNPFALIGEYYDAQDAVDQLKEKLEQRLSSLKSPQPKEEGKKEGKTPEFEAGPVQPSETLPPKKEEKVKGDKIAESIEKKITFV